MWPKLAEKLDRYQLQHSSVYRRWRQAQEKNRKNSSKTLKPCLPIIAFKESEACCFRPTRKTSYFESSGTTSGGHSMVSRHHFRSLDLYRASVIEGWKWFLQTRDKNCRLQNDFPHDKRAHFVALMPSFSEKPHSSLSCMSAILMKEFGDGEDFWCMKSGRWNWTGLCHRLLRLERQSRKSVLFGTAFAWVRFLDWCAVHGRRFHLPPDALVLETGGYKGRSRTLERSDLHQSLGKLLGIHAAQIHSEYSMCELSSQAYSFRFDTVVAVCDRRRGPLRKIGGHRPPLQVIFRFPPWCQHRVVKPGSSNPSLHGKAGVLEIHDLANVDSCAFIRTEDMAIQCEDGFELLGRLPRAGLKGCSLESEQIGN